MAVIPLTISGLKEAQADLERLNQEFEKVKNDPIKSKKIAKEFNDLSKEVDKATEELVKMNEAGKLLGVRFDDLNEVLYGTQQEILPLTSQIGEMEDRMYQLAAAGQAGNAEFTALQAETARLRKVIIDTDKSVDLLAENRGLSVFSTGLSQVGERLLALDFEGAAKDATAMNQAVGNLGQMGKSAITGLFKTVGQLTKAFATLGASLLANPIFLIAAAVTALVAVLGLVADKLGFLQPILEAVGQVFEAMKWAVDRLVQSIKDFLDWLGLTNFAAKDFAAQQQEAMQRVIDKSKELEQSISERYDREIALAQIAGEDTAEAEVKKQKAIIATATIRQKALEAQIKANETSKKLTDEEIEKLQEQLRETNKLIDSSQFEIQKINKRTEVEQAKSREQEAEKNRQNYERMLADRKKYEQDRLNAMRQIRDLELQMLEDGINKDLALNAEKYKRLIEDTLKNESYNQEEKDKLVSLLKEQEFETTKEIELGYAQQLDEALKAADKEREEADKERKAKEAELQKATAEALIEERKKQYEQELAEQEALAEARYSVAEGLTKGLQGLEQLLAQTGVQTAGLQKTIALVQIATDTAKAISAVIAGATAAAAAGGPAAPFLLAGYIASGIGTITGAIASAYAALKEAPSLGGSVGGGGAALASAGNVTAAQPNVNLFGQNNNANNLSTPQDVETNQEIVVKAFVSESDVTGTQNKIKKLTESAAL